MGFTLILHLTCSPQADMDVESFSEGILAAISTAEGERANVSTHLALSCCTTTRPTRPHTRL